MENERRLRLKFVLFDLGGDPKKVEANAIKLYNDTESSYRHDWLDDILNETEDDCVCNALLAAILDAYFGSMPKQTAISLRDALGEYGTICLYTGCDDLVFSGGDVADNYNARHQADQISRLYTGYQPFEI